MVALVQCERCFGEVGAALGIGGPWHVMTMQISFCSTRGEGSSEGRLCPVAVPVCMPSIRVRRQSVT